MAILTVNNSYWAHFSNPQVDAAMAKASEITDQKKRDEAWGKIDEMVTSLAPVVNWFWDKQPNIQSKNVQGVIAQWNAAYDLSFTSLK